MRNSIPYAQVITNIRYKNDKNAIPTKYTAMGLIKERVKEQNYFIRIVINQGEN